jgi:uncharacterized protein (TIGR02598 family)
MKCKFLKKLRAGFSLIEVNMAIFVLAGGALALLGLFPLGLRESLSARNEMKMATFAERVINSARIAATKPDLKSVGEFIGEVEDQLGNIKVMDDQGDMDDSNAEYDDDFKLYYRVWVMEDRDWAADGTAKLGNKRVAQVGVQVTADNVKRNVNAWKTAPVYVARVVLDVQNEE